MTLDEILNLDIKDINRMIKKDPREFRRLVSRINAVAAKRVKRLEQSGIKTPSLSAFTKGGGVKSIRGQDISFVKSQFGKVKRFLESGQSTVTGAKKFQKEVEERMGIGDLKGSQIPLFWGVYNKLKERFPDFGRFVPSEELIQYLHDEIFHQPDITMEQLLYRASNWLDERYEGAEWADLEDIGGGVSEFFDD